MSTQSAANRNVTVDRPKPIAVGPDQKQLLRIYLRDHEAAAAGGLQLSRRCWSANHRTPYEADLQRLTESIRADRDDLRTICKQCGVEFSRIRRAMAFAGATLGRLKLNGRVFAYSPLSRVVELEALSAGVTSKLRLWESLLQVAAVDERLNNDELARHATDAHDQLNVLRRLHDLAADEAFT